MTEKRELENPENPPEKKQKVEHENKTENAEKPSEIPAIAPPPPLGISTGEKSSDNALFSPRPDIAASLGAGFGIFSPRPGPSVPQNDGEMKPMEVMEVDEEKQQEEEEESESMQLSDDSYVEPAEEEVEGKEDSKSEESEEAKPEEPPKFFLKKSVSFVEQSIAKRKKSRNKLRRVPSYCKIWNGIKLEGDVDDEEEENMDEPPLLRRQSSWGPAVEKKKKKKLQERRQRLLGRLKDKLKTISREDLGAYKPTHVVWFDICEDTGDETWYVVKLENHTFTEEGNASVLKVKFCGYSDEVWNIPAISGDHSHIYWCHKVLLTSRFCDLGYPDNLNAVKSHLESLPRRRKKARSAARSRRAPRSRRGGRTGRSGWGGTLNISNRQRSPSPPKGPPKEVTLKGVVTDASQASTKIKAKLKVLSHSTQRTVECESGDDGKYEVKVDTGLVKITCAADGYADGEHLVHVYKDMDASNETEICLSKAIADDGTIRIVLRWGHSPRDLDSHLFVPAMTKEEQEKWDKENPKPAAPVDNPPAANPPSEDSGSAGGIFNMGGLFGSSAVTSFFNGSNVSSSSMSTPRIRVSYQNKNYASGNCRISLDRDVTNSFGPETVTIQKMEDLPKHIDYLEYIIHDYSGNQHYHLGKSKAIVYVYQKNKCQSYSVSNDQFVSGSRYWHVFRINRETGTLETVNKFTKKYPTTKDLETVTIPYSLKPIAPKFDETKFNREQIQVVFSFDTTGSMYKCLATVRNYLKEIISKLLKEIPNLSIGLIAHGDYGDVTSSYVMKSIDLTQDVDALCKFVNRVGETSGYDNDECYELVLHNITRDFSWDASCKYRSLVLIGDANPHPVDSENNPFKIDWEKEADCCKENGIKIYGVHCLGTPYAEAFYRSITQKTGGLYVDLGNLDEFVGMMTAICHRELSLALKAAEAGGEAQAVNEDDSPEKKRFIEECKKLEEFTCADLKDKLRKNRQKVSGSKQELIERIVDCKLYGCYPKCKNCGGGRVKVIYDREWTHNGEGQYYCNGYYDDDQFQHCNWRGTKADVERPDWQD